MDEENNSTVNTTGAEKEKDQNKKQNGGALDKAKKAKDTANKAKNAAQKAKKLASASKSKAIQSIATKLPAVGTVGLVALIIILVIGLIGFFTSLPGTFIESIKEFGQNLWSGVIAFWNGDNATASVTEEDQIALAQKIQDMGYDVVGYGFADAQYEYDDAENAEDIDGIQNGKIVGISPFSSSKNYLQAYIAQSEATYVLATWNLVGSFESIITNVGNIWSQIVGDPTNAQFVDANVFSEGMINIKDIDGVSGAQYYIDRDKKQLRIDGIRNTKALF